MALAAMLAGAAMLSTPAASMAAAPPSIVASSTAVVVDENQLAILQGTYDDPDGDAVTLTASEGDIEKDYPGLGSWRWTFPALDGPYQSTVTLTAEDATGASSSATFAFEIRNVAPIARTDGPRLVPVNSKAPRRFEWTAFDTSADTVTATIGCGTGIKGTEGDTTQSGTRFFNCTFPTAGATHVGVQASDEDGGVTDGRMATTATTRVTSIADGRLVVNGPSGNVRAGGALAVADLTGDSKADIAIGMVKPNWSAHGEDPGYVEVVLGRSEAGSVDLDSLAAGAGFRIVGPADEQFGWSIGAAGDVNGDGRADLIIGAPSTSPSGRSAGGAAWLIYGAASTADVEISNLASSRGFRIAGAEAFDGAGAAVAGAGDVNGDGYADVVIGAPGAGDHGIAYVILGGASSGDIDLASIPAGRGFRITGAGLATGSMVSAGDVNGDGKSDVLVAGSGLHARVVTVYGRSSPTDVNGSSIGSAGFVIGTGGGLDPFAIAAGDMDGDGRADVAISHGSSQYLPVTWPVSVIRGGATNASIDYLTTAPNSRLTRYVLPDRLSATGVGFADYLRDGRSELLVAAHNAENNGEGSGSVYAVRGAATLQSVDLGVLSTAWTRTDGDTPDAHAGASTAVGDVTGDGIPDLILAAAGLKGTAGDLAGRVGVFAGTRIDASAPTATSPVHRILTGVAVSSGKVTIRLDWTGSDTGAGIARYEVAQSTNGGAWTSVTASAMTPRLSRALPTGADYRFRVRAVDRADNRSAWKYGATFRLSGYQEGHAAIRYAGTWTTARASSYWGGAVRRSSTAGARATFTFTGRSVAWVAATGPTRGSARIYVNGSYAKTISLYSATNQPARVVAAWRWSTYATRTIAVRVTGTTGHPRVDVDGFAVIR